jgi:hypothetical protein
MQRRAPEQMGAGLSVGCKHHGALADSEGDPLENPKSPICRFA